MLHWAFAAMLLLGAPGTAAERDWTTFEFEAYNREYLDIRSNARWKREGAIQATISSPSHRLTIRDHTVDLRAHPDGTHETRIRVNFSGEGDLVAEIAMAGARTDLEDHVVAPQQEIEVLARLRFERVDGGYEVETVELPESVEVEIESEMGGQILVACRSALAILGVGCSGVEAMFSSATVPLPRAGGTYFISESTLSETERRRLDRYLDVDSTTPAGYEK